MKKLSIIIPNYNKAKYLVTLLEQLKEQINDDVEVIVVDDCSTDNSWELLQLYKDVFKIYKTETNSWVSHTRNVGLDKAKGKYVTFIDSDDGIKDIFIETILGGIESNRDGYFYDYEIVNVRNNSPVEKGYNTMVWTKVFKRSVLNKNNIRFDEEYFTHNVLGEDLQFITDFLEVTTDVQVSQIAIIDYHWGVSKSVSNQNQVAGKGLPRYESFYPDHLDYFDRFFK